MTGGDTMLTVQQVADELQVNIETVRRWLRKGELHGVDMGHRIGYRVRRSDLNAFIEQKGKGDAA